MILEKLHIIITLFAALITTIIGIVTNMSLYELSVRLIIVILAFYIVGIIVRYYLMKNVFPKPEETDSEEIDEQTEQNKDENTRTV